MAKPEMMQACVKEPTIIEGENKKLDVKVKSRKEFYKTEEKVKVDLHVTKDNPLNNEPVELAVVVLNEEVFQLVSQGKDYFNPHKVFYSDFKIVINIYYNINIAIAISLSSCIRTE